MDEKSSFRGKIKIFWLIVIFVVLLAVFILFGWKIPVVLKIETLHLPDGCEIVYPTKVWISDVYWLHIKGEKVIKCRLGYEAVKEYIEVHNSSLQLKNIDIDPYGGMSDIAIYDAEFDADFWKQPDQDNYIKINYLYRLY